MRSGYSPGIVNGSRMSCTDILLTFCSVKSWFS